MDKNIYKMKLHETLQLEVHDAFVFKVHNGWIYKFYNIKTAVYDNLVFVPDSKLQHARMMILETKP